MKAYSALSSVPKTASINKLLTILSAALGNSLKNKTPLQRTLLTLIDIGAQGPKEQ